MESHGYDKHLSLQENTPVRECNNIIIPTANVGLLRLSNKSPQENTPVMVSNNIKISTANVGLLRLSNESHQGNTPVMEYNDIIIPNGQCRITEIVE